MSLLRQTHPKPKLLRSNPLRYSLIRLDGQDPCDVAVDDEDIYVGYRRPVLVECNKNCEHDDISDHAKFRLWLARQLALKKFRENQVA